MVPDKFPTSMLLAARGLGLAFVLLAMTPCAYAGRDITDQCTFHWEGERIDLGDITAALNSNIVGRQQVTVGKRQMPLEVLCPKPVVLSLRLSEGSGRFGERGLLAFTVASAVADGQRTLLAENYVAGVRNFSAVPTMRLSSQSFVGIAPSNAAGAERYSLAIDIEATLPRVDTRARFNLEVAAQGAVLLTATTVP